MMDCETTRELIGPWIDRQLPPAESAALEAHLATCEECRAASESLRALDSDLLRSFQPQRQAAGEVAARVLQSLAAERPSPRPVLPSRWRRWSPPLASAAAGFLVATIFYQPWKRNDVGWFEDNVSPIPPINKFTHKNNLPPEQMLLHPVASLIATTGDVEMCDSSNSAWRPVASKAALPPECEVRTGPLVQCELKTAGGCVVRLNQGTQIKLNSAEQIEIAQGQIWCSAPQDVSLKVSTSAAMQEYSPQAQWSPQVFTCPSLSTTMAEMKRDGGLQVTAAEGTTELQTPTGKETLARGESASIVDNQIVKSPQHMDLILTTSWINSLLMRKGGDDPELDSRVNKLLAELGRSKIEHLYEQEIRALGEYSVLPLLRYVTSSADRSPASHQKALRILADVAPTGSIPGLISLLEQDDPDTRFYAAKALLRLTGLDQGRTPDHWREDRQQCQPTVEAWNRWKRENIDLRVPLDRKT